MENGSDTKLPENCCSQTEHVTAHSDFVTTEINQLSFKKGQSFIIHDKTNENWWWAELDGNYGFVPVNYLVNKEDSTSADWQDEEYFSSYGNLKLHHEMLSDKPRTQAYMNAIVKNSAHLKGKTVLDIGCGSGILSMMCAKLGQADKVYAVEVSQMAEHTQEVIKHNNLAHNIEVIKDYAENLKLDQQVDLIISEWMGTILLFEMMVEAVILARDKHLKKGGKMWPSSARLLLVPCSADAQYSSQVEFWDSQFGFDFSCLKNVAKTDLLKKPFHDYILPKGDCLSAEQCVLELDMSNVTAQDLEEIISDFEFIVKKDGQLHGFCTWFEVEFSPFSEDIEMVTLNTGPDHEMTHWKQNLFLLDEPVEVKESNVVCGTITLVRNQEWRRHFRVHIKYKVLCTKTLESQVQHGEKLFHVWR